MNKNAKNIRKMYTKMTEYKAQKKKKKQERKRIVTLCQKV